MHHMVLDVAITSYLRYASHWCILTARTKLLANIDTTEWQGQICDPMMFAIEHLINHEKKPSCVQPLYLRAGAWIIELAEVLFRHDRTEPNLSLQSLP